MYALLYRSSATCPFDARAERAVEKAAAARNGLWSLSTLLLHGTCADGRAGFAQWIEGEHEAVEALFALIAADPRHDGVSVLGRGDGLRGAPLLNGHGMRTVAMDMLPETLDAFVLVASDLFVTRSEPVEPTG